MSRTEWLQRNLQDLHFQGSTLHNKPLPAIAFYEDRCLHKGPGQKSRPDLGS